MATELVLNEELYERFLLEAIPQSTKKFLWIGTADLKDLHVRNGRRFTPWLAQLAQLVERGVEIRLLHAKEPGPRFRRSFDLYPALTGSERFERLLCPRVHFKTLIIDGRRAYVGSANVTGAGMGAKHRNRRNFEAGIITDDPQIVRRMMDQYEAVFLGHECAKCRLKQVCPDPID